MREVPGLSGPVAGGPVVRDGAVQEVPPTLVRGVLACLGEVGVERLVVGDRHGPLHGRLLPLQGVGVGVGGLAPAVLGPGAAERREHLERVAVVLAHAAGRHGVRASRCAPAPARPRPAPSPRPRRACCRRARSRRRRAPSRRRRPSRPRAPPRRGHRARRAAARRATRPAPGAIGRGRCGGPRPPGRAGRGRARTGRVRSSRRRGRPGTSAGRAPAGRGGTRRGPCRSWTPTLAGPRRPGALDRDRRRDAAAAASGTCGWAPNLPGGGRMSAHLGVPETGTRRHENRDSPS